MCFLLCCYSRWGDITPNCVCLLLCCYSRWGDITPNCVFSAVTLLQVVFSQSGRGTAQSSSHNYKVFLKAEDTKRKKKSDVWSAPAAEASSKNESWLTLVYLYKRS